MHTRSLPQIAKGESVPAANPLPSFVGDVPRVLNVGGSSKAIPIPAHYSGWGHLLLDIDPTGNPDIVWDARALDMLNPAQFDAVYCSHNLEHYYKHDGAKVLRGFLHVLKPDGFADIRVPDLRCVLRKFVADDMDLEDVLYTAPGGFHHRARRHLRVGQGDRGVRPRFLRPQDRLHAAFAGESAAAGGVRARLHPHARGALRGGSVRIQECADR
jgi:predicted SAM-dependent methyltransferase